MEDRFDTNIDDLWSALTDPGRLAHWLGEVEGDLRLGGEFRFRFFASGSEGTGRVEACEPSRRLLLTMALGQPDEDVIEATLTADGGQTILVWEERGMPLDLLAAYGAGVQIHVEDLAAYLAGRDRVERRRAVGRTPVCLSTPGGQRQLGTGRRWKLTGWSSTQWSVRGPGQRYRGFRIVPPSRVRHHRDHVILFMHAMNRVP